MQSPDIRRVVMSRRGFLLRITALCAVIAVPMARWIRQTEDTRVVQALRGRYYPGPVRPLDQESVSRPGKWAG